MIKTTAQFQELAKKTDNAIDTLQSLPPNQRDAYVAAHPQDFSVALSGGLPQQQSRLSSLLGEREKAK